MGIYGRVMEPEVKGRCEVKTAEEIIELCLGPDADDDGVLVDMVDFVIRETVGAACAVLDDARREQHNLGPDDRIGDGAPAALAYGYEKVRALIPKDKP